jgi:enoyl-CoA hydratase/carnithine racemase
VTTTDTVTAPVPPVPPVQPSTLRLELRDHVLGVTLNRPDKLNAFNRTMQDELEQVWTWADTEPWVRVALITGAGDRAFCSGVDIHASAEERASMGERRWTEVAVIGSRLTPRQFGSTLPTVVAVNGVCAGGGLYFVGDADIAVCSDGAWFTDPHVSSGRVSALEPIGLRGRIPDQWVMRLALGGRHERIDAATALRIGLVTEVFEGAAGLQRGAWDLAAKIATAAPLALRRSVEAIRAAEDLPRDQALANGLRLAQENTRTHDHAEGTRAQIERREPRWEGR